MLPLVVYVALGGVCYRWRRMLPLVACVPLSGVCYLGGVCNRKAAGCLHEPMALGFDTMAPSARDDVASVSVFAGTGALVHAETPEHLCRHDGNILSTEYVTDESFPRCILARL